MRRLFACGWGFERKGDVSPSALLSQRQSAKIPNICYEDAPLKFETQRKNPR